MTDAPEKHEIIDDWIGNLVCYDDGFYGMEPYVDGEWVRYESVELAILEKLKLNNARIAKLEAFIDKAFEAHSNLDLDIEALQENN
jgi:hypothetical protein